MNTQTEITYHETRHSIKKTRLIAVLSVALSGYTSQALAAGDSASDYYENILLNPSETILLAEAKGRVTIYDGLENSVIDQALDTQFGRMENMMFVRTRETLPDGSEEVDGDCD